MPDSSVELKVFRDLKEIPREAWDGVLEPGDNPFVSWTFLAALEASASAAPRRGWWPCHLTAWQDGELVAAAPAYVKNDSAGDFSRDWGLADSAQASSGPGSTRIGVPRRWTRSRSSQRFHLRTRLDRRSHRC